MKLYSIGVGVGFVLGFLSLVVISLRGSDAIMALNSGEIILLIFTTTVHDSAPDSLIL